MQQANRILSTYTADVSGVCSALYELGGMIVMHDASGCNSTYNTHDEPRWYETDSMVFLSGLTETEAILGDDEKLISDVVRTALSLHPRFIAIAGSPIPMLAGTDFEAIARVVEARTYIPTFGFATNGMRPYYDGIGQALATYAARFTAECPRTAKISANLLGVTPLDFVRGEDRSLRQALTEAGMAVQGVWAVGSAPEELQGAAGAWVNLVVSAAGLAPARLLRERYGTPYCIGRPCGDGYTAHLMREIKACAEEKTPPTLPENADSGKVFVIGEPVCASSAARALRMEKIAARAICPLPADAELTAEIDFAKSEETLEKILSGASAVLADPLYRPVVPSGARLIALPHEAYSGRIFRENALDLLKNFDIIKKEAIEL